MLSSLLNFVPGLGQAKLALMAVALIGVFLAGWKVESWRWGAAETAAVEQAAAHREAVAAKQNEAAQAAEVKKENVRVVTETITRTVDKIVERPVYRDRCLDDDGLRAANAALSGRAADPAKPDATLPAARTP